MTELIDNTAGNNEKGYWGKYNNDDILQFSENDFFESAEGEFGMEPSTPQDPIDSYIHNHFNGTQPNEQPLNSLPVFSGADLYSVYWLAQNGRIADLSNFVMFVATPGQSASADDDTLYAMTISNPVQFNNVVSSLGVVPDLIDQDYGRKGINPNVSTELNEKRLAEIIKERKYGFSLYRGNRNDLTEWTRIKIKSNGAIRENNCN